MLKIMVFALVAPTVSGGLRGGLIGIKGFVGGLRHQHFNILYFDLSGPGGHHRQRREV